MNRLTVPELPRLRRIGREFAEAANLPGGFCESHFEEFWVPLIYEDLGVIFYEENESGEIIGVFGGLFSTGMFSGWKIASESFWWVSPEARGKSLSRRLKKAFEDEAAVRKCQEVLLVCLTALDPDIVSGMLVRDGYAASEIVHRKII